MLSFGGPIAVITRYADVDALLTDPRTRQIETEGLALMGITEGSLHRFYAHSMLTSNPPAHKARRAPASRAFGFKQEPGTFLGEPFRAVPQYPYGRADWDLIARAFLDIGRTINSDAFSFEEDDTLVGTGIGVELQYRTNINVRLDWGFALEEIEGEVSSGSSQVHFIATVMF